VRVKFANSASKHYVSKPEIIKIITSKTGIKIGESQEKRDKIAWIGDRDFGEKIEIIAINFVTYYYVIHAMPIKDRGGEENDYLEDLW
jgi:NOL1/NOP2/fmu family ribosome biogenesis protein